MRKQLSLSVLAFSLVLATGIILSVTVLNRNTAAKKPVPIANAAELYRSAVNSIPDISALQYRTEQARLFYIGNTAFTERSEQYITVCSDPENGQSYQISGTMQTGDHQIQFTECFQGETVYSCVAGADFQSSIPLSEYQKRVVPLTLISEIQYRNITGTQTDGITTVTFQNARGFESWFPADGKLFCHASGTVKLDVHNRILSSTYTVVYETGNTRIRHSFVTACTDDTAPVVTAPDSAESYTSIPHPDIPIALERAVGYLVSTAPLHSQYTDRIFCQVFGDVREQKGLLKTDNSDGWSANVETIIETQNASKAGTAAKSTQTESFVSGQYTLSANGAPPQQDPSITVDIMKKHCNDLMIGTIILPQHIASISVHVTDDTVTYVFIPTDSFTDTLRSEACQLLYADPNVFSGSEYQTQLRECYLTVDRSLGFPLSSGFATTGIYTIEGIAYRLEYTADQTYSVP